jgi:hypothetical protein
MGDTPSTVTLLGKPERVIIPEDYALLEELFTAANGATGPKLLRVYSAMVGLCCPEVGRMSKANYSRHSYDPISYGREVYSWLHRQRVPMSEIIEAGSVLYPAILLAAFPRADEVADALGKSKGSEER